MTFSNENLRDYLVNKKILITGGAGFIGSNITSALSQYNCHTYILDNFNKNYGGNKYNFTGISAEKYSIIEDSVLNISKYEDLIKKTDCIIHLAAQVSYIDSLNYPDDDYDLTAKSTLNLLELLRKHNLKPKILFSSSRMVLGKSQYSPIDENHPTNPLTIYGVHKLTSEKYLEIYGREFGIPYTIFRITNPYGIKQQVKHSKYSLVGWFIRQAIEGKTIKIFGEGEQKRDYIYIDDVVNAFVKAITNEKVSFQRYNLGRGNSEKFSDMVKKIVSIVPGSKYEFNEWPSNYEKIETGDLEIDISKITNDLSWEAKVTLDEGIRKTYNYFKDNMKYYI